MIDEDTAHAVRYGMALERSKSKALSSLVDIVREAAIEECAQWIEQHGGNNETANGLRTLKEQSNG